VPESVSLPVQGCVRHMRLKRQCMYTAEVYSAVGGVRGSFTSFTSFTECYDMFYLSGLPRKRRAGLFEGDSCCCSRISRMLRYLSAHLISHLKRQRQRQRQRERKREREKERERESVCV
jgi:hypothetical protein